MMHARLCLICLLGACGSDGATESTGAMESTGASEPTSSTGPGDAEWPRRVTLVTPGVAAESDGVRLQDGSTVAGGGDLRLYQAMVLSLRAATPMSVCAKGEVAALADVPTDVETCPGSLTDTWEDFMYLDAATLHPLEESNAAGFAALVRVGEPGVLYRLRVVGDSYAMSGISSVVFDYEPVPVDP